MKIIPRYPGFTALILFLSVYSTVLGQKINEYDYNNNFNPDENTVYDQFQFNGYTNYWHDTYENWIRYGNLFKMAAPDVNKTIAQSKVDIADDMGVPGLTVEEGFINGVLAMNYLLIEDPSMQQLEDALTKGSVLVLTDPSSEAGKQLCSKLPSNNEWKDKLKSHQYAAKDLVAVKAFYLTRGHSKIYVVSSASKELRTRILGLIKDTKAILDRYDLKRGWFGAETLLKSVTCTPGHPLEVIGKGMNEGNSWFTFSGYMDFLAQNELEEWLAKTGNPVVADVGFGSIYGCSDYEGLQVQSMFTPDSWIDFAHKKNGYVFRQVFDTLADPFQYDGYMAGEGNKEQIDNEDVPFVTTTGTLAENAIPCMVLFSKKGQPFNRETLWKCILDRREVAVLGNGKMMGPARYRNALELLLLDRVFLEEYFGDRINLDASTDKYNILVTITNTYPHAVSGKLKLTLPPELSPAGETSRTINLPAGNSQTLSFSVSPLVSAMNNTNPVVINFTWNGHKKGTMTMLDLPPAISVHRLMYGHAPVVTYPVSIHNFTDQTSFPVKVEVIDKINPKKIVFRTTQTCEVPEAEYRDYKFDLKVRPGNYQVKVTAIGTEYTSQLGVGSAKGNCKITQVDLNGDGVNEYRLENDSVRVTLLRTGARVIEYFIKSRNDNVLFKLWPEKAIDDRRPFRKRGYYPYGGFEDFLGQGSMETHKLYDADILKSKGDYVRVRMTADYYGNKLVKTFTLYGDTPLLEIRFALDFKNPEANVIGPQPILELGKKHWTEDVFTVPNKTGLEQYHMRPDRYYGRVFFLKEGWNAGYDTEADISYVGAYPVSQPLFLHMWMNHPRNPDAHHYYTEFQPWVPIYQKTTMYFSYYMWGTGGPWQNGVEALRKINLISER